MLMQLPYSVYQQYNRHLGNGQSALLQAVRTSIEKTYAKTSIKADGQVILVPFNDGITFEVVPGFINTDNSYTHPDANGGGSWRTTDPRSEIEAIRTRNGECNGNLVRLCRMMRSWKNDWSVPIGGLLIDTLALQGIQEGAACLAENEDMTFSDAEIDAFLPKELKRSSRAREVLNRETEKIAPQTDDAQRKT